MKESSNIYVETSGTLPESVEMSIDVDENPVLFGSELLYYGFTTQIDTNKAAEISNKGRRKA